jgi:hypothetical protein
MRGDEEHASYEDDGTPHWTLVVLASIGALSADWYPIQVKQKDKVGRPDIDSFEAVMMREDRTQGFFVSFDFSSDAMKEIQAFFKKSGKSIIALTVKDILDEQIAYKLT